MRTMPLGHGWLVNVRDYFVEAPFAICLVAHALHLFYSKLGYYKHLDRKEYEDDF